MFIPANIFQPLIDVFETVLKFFHSTLGGSWGWSIVLLTITIRACLIPLTVRQIRSMARMQQLQPELKAHPGEVQGGQAAPAAGDDEVLQGEQRQPFELLPTARRAAAGLRLAVLHAAQEPARGYLPGGPGEVPGGIRGRVTTSPCRRQAGRRHPCGVRHGAGFLFIDDLTNKATGVTLVILILLYVGTQLGSTLMMSGATVDQTQRGGSCCSCR